MQVEVVLLSLRVYSFLRFLGVVKNRFTTETYWGKKDERENQIFTFLKNRGNPRHGKRTDRLGEEEEEKNTTCQFYNTAWSSFSFFFAFFCRCKRASGYFFL
jgi:hypothetical protein